MNYRFGDHVLDTGSFTLTADGDKIPIEPQVFSLLLFLIENCDRVVSKDEIFEQVWDGRIVSDGTLNSRINSIRRALGDDGKAQAFIKTFPRRGFRFVATLRGEKEAVPKQVSNTGRVYDKPLIAVLPLSISSADQNIKFSKSPDRVQIAYSTFGYGPPVIFVASWLTHLELDWNIPSRREIFEMLAPKHTVVRYDARGNGLSDWEVDDISFEASVGDLTAVIDDLDLDRFALFGQSQGSAIAAVYAARHPEKVTHLALYGGFARGRRKRGSKGQIAESEAFVTMIREGWGKDIDTYVQMFGTFFMPDANAEQLAGFTNFQRMATPPENAARIQLALDQIDIVDELSNITAPTLVLHVREDARVPFDEGRRLAAEISGARFVPLEGRNHIMLIGEPAQLRYVDEIEGFLQS